MRTKYLLTGVTGIVIGMLISSTLGLAGSLDPLSGPTDPASQMYTLEQIYDRANDGTVATKMTSFTEPSSGPTAGTGRTLDEVMAVVGNPDPPCSDGTTNRYVDCGNGTVYDTETDLLWLKNANCYGALDWTAASNAAAGLEDGECGLTDNSSPGDWRLPTKSEWEATVAQAKDMECYHPPLTNTPGTGCYSDGPQPFTGVLSDLYWSSTVWEEDPSAAWFMYMTFGYMDVDDWSISHFVWPVRGGQ
jgi:hypothetical protein